MLRDHQRLLASIPRMLPALPRSGRHSLAPGRNGRQMAQFMLLLGAVWLGLNQQPVWSQQWQPASSPRPRSLRGPSTVPPVGSPQPERSVDRPVPKLAARPEPVAATPVPVATAQGAAAVPVSPPSGVGVAPAPGHAAPIAGNLPLPHDAGQVWREYDLRPFLARFPRDEAARRDVLDWILRETGTDTWFGEHASLLNIAGGVARVYHREAVQAQVAGIVERFNSLPAERQAVYVQLMTVSSPDWRLAAMRKMKPVQVHSPGVDAWLLSREDAALLIHDLAGRSDFRRHGPSGWEIVHGRSQTIDEHRPQKYKQGLDFLPDSTWPGYALRGGQIDTGFRLMVSPLFAASADEVEVALDCQVDQLERMVPLTVDVPTTVDPRQRVELEVPQMSSWQLRERFRWPADQVLVVSRGVAATPHPDARGSLDRLPLLNLKGAGERGEAILFVESRSQSGGAAGAPPSLKVDSAQLDARGRY